MPVTPHAAPPPRPVPRPVDPGQPFTWLARGWADLLRQPVPGLLHGLATAGDTSEETEECSRIS